MQRMIGALLTLLAGIVACAFVLADKLSDWREKRRSALTSSRIRAEVKRIRHLANQQRDQALHRTEEMRTPAIVIAARIGLMLMFCAVAGVLASQCSSSRPRCHWFPRHRDTLTENINGKWICDPEVTNGKRNSSPVSQSSSP